MTERMHPDDIKFLAELIIAPLEKQITNHSTEMKEIKSDLFKAFKEIHDVTFHFSQRVDALQALTDKYELAAIRATEKANEAEKEVEKTEVRIGNQIKECREGEPGRIEKHMKKNPMKPKYSGKQVAAMITIYLAIAGFIGGYTILVMENIKTSVTQIDKRLYSLETGK